jgi:hypothetical protein
MGRVSLHVVVTELNIVIQLDTILALFHAHNIEPAMTFQPYTPITRLIILHPHT